MRSIKMKVNGEEFYIEQAYNGDWWITGLKDGYKTWSMWSLEAIELALKHLGEDRIANIFEGLKDEKYLKAFSYHFDSARYNEKDWTIQIAEQKMNEFLSNMHERGKLTYSINDITFPDTEYYDEEDWTEYLIREQIGWHIWSSVYNLKYIDRQKMSVTVRCSFGQIEPQWFMEYRNPEFLGYELDLDKIGEEAKKMCERA